MSADTAHPWETFGRWVLEAAREGGDTDGIKVSWADLDALRTALGPEGKEGGNV